MKSCPICHLQYADDQTFCLQDGTVLVPQRYDEQQTVINPNYRTNQNIPAAKGTANVILYVILGLILIGVMAVAGLLLLRSGNPPVVNNANSEPTRPSNTAVANVAIPGEKPLPPVQPMTIPNGQRYSGNIGNSAAVFDLVWKKDKSVSGVYFYNSSPSQTYSVSGNNYRDGELELSDNSGGASIKMYKTLTRDKVCWSGNYYANGGSSAISFCRYR